MSHLSCSFNLRYLRNLIYKQYQLLTSTGRSENKNMMQFSRLENEVTPGVVMFIIRFFIFAGIASVILRYGNQIRPFCRMRTKIVTSVNESFCRMSATPGLALSSNSVNNAKPLFSERPINSLTFNQQSNHFRSN